MPTPKIKPPPLGAKVWVRAVFTRGQDPDQPYDEIRAGKRRALWARSEPRRLKLPQLGTFVGLRAVRDTQRVPGYYDADDGGEPAAAKVLKAYGTWLVAFSARGKHWHALPEDCTIVPEEPS